MTVSTFVQTDATTQPVNTYNANLDGDVSVLTRLSATFAPHAQALPDMTVAIDAGHIFNGLVLTEVAAQSAVGIVPPATSPRIDRVVVNRLTGTASIVAGAEASVPVPPAIPAGTVPVAQVLIQPSTTSIGNADILDERDLNALGTSGAPTGLLNVRTFTTPGSYTYTPTSGTTKILVEVQGGGGGGGGATPSSGLQAAAPGGCAGSYARSFLTTGFAGATVIVGAGGLGRTGGSGGTKGNSSLFGSIQAPGGWAGASNAAGAGPTLKSTGSNAAAATGGNIVNTCGAAGGYGFVLGVSSDQLNGGYGGASYFGSGGEGGTVFGTNGSNAVSPGAGGGGATTMPSSPSVTTGGTGADGVVIVYEYA